VQKYINFWYSSSTDLYGSEVSSNSANFFAAGLKGRAYEDRYEEHKVSEGSMKIERFLEGKLVAEEVAMRNAMNEVLRNEYLTDCQKGIDYWNRITEKQGVPFRFTLPHRRFHRKIGDYAAGKFDYEGNPISEAQWNAKVGEWLPTEKDRAFIQSLMKPCLEPGKTASWIAAPAKGINNQAPDYEYVKLGA